MKASFILLLGAGVGVAPISAQESPASPPLYEAVRTIAPPIMDGRLNDPSWATAQWTRDFMDIRGPDHPTPRLRTRVKLLWDDDFLYVAAEMEEHHLWGTLTERDAIIYRDDDFEVFLDPDGNGAGYFEVEINALGTVFDLFLDKPYQEGGRAHIPWNLQGLQSAVSHQGTLNDPRDQDRGWTVELAIPWKGLVPPEPFADPGASPGTPSPASSIPPAPPRPGDEWRVNFSRVEWPLEIVPDEASGLPQYRISTAPSREHRHPEENWVWSPQGVINMHIPDRWGVVRFRGAHSSVGSS